MSIEIKQLQTFLQQYDTAGKGFYAIRTRRLLKTGIYNIAIKLSIITEQNTPHGEFNINIARSFLESQKAKPSTLWMQSEYCTRRKKQKTPKSTGFLAKLRKKFKK